MAIKEAERLKQVEEYYFSKKLKEIAELNKSGYEVINLGIGNPDLPPSRNTIDALLESANQPGNHGYQSYKSTPELRKAIAEYYAKYYGTNLKQETEILPLIGSKEGIMHISTAFVNPGDEVLVPNPGYPVYSAAAKLMGAVVNCYDLTKENNWQINIDELKSRDLSEVKIMWINYPHMPTGAVASKEMFGELIKLACENNFILCNDNPYGLVLNDNPASLLSTEGAMNVALELNSLSKSHNMAGWRVGWVAGNKDYVASVLKVKSNIDSGIFLPVQHAAAEALRNPDKWHSERNNVLKSRREKVFELLDLLDCTYDTAQAGMFVWAKIPAVAGSSEIFVNELLDKARVFMSPGFIFGSNGELYVRVSLCSNKQKLNDAIQRIKTSFKKEEEAV